MEEVSALPEEEVSLDHRNVHGFIVEPRTRTPCRPSERRQVPRVPRVWRRREEEEMSVPLEEVPTQP